MRQDDRCRPGRGLRSAEPGAARAPARRSPRLLLLVPALAILGVLLILPLGIILVYSFLTPAAFGGVIWQLSPAAYLQFLFERDIFDDS